MKPAEAGSAPTPGPWRADYVIATTGATRINSPRGNVAWVCGNDSQAEPTPAETRANARLIAAAPDLLAACEALLPLCDGLNNPGPGDREYQLVVAAIAKAREG